MTTDTLSSMRTFVAIVEAGSFTAAARRLGLSVPTISRRVTVFEERLSASLMNRTTRNFDLTEYGLAYYTKAKRVLSEVEDAESHLAKTRTEPSGLLRVAAPNVFARRHIVPLIPEFFGLYPKVRIKLLLDSAANLTSDEVDAAVHMGLQPRKRGVQARTLGSFRQVLCASPEYVKRQGAPSRPEDLGRLDCVLQYMPERNATWVFRQRGREITLPVEGRLVCNDADAVLIAILAGVGVALLPAFLVRDHVQAQRLQILLAEFEPPATRVEIAYARDCASSSNAAAFVRFLSDRIAQENLDL